MGSSQMSLGQSRALWPPLCPPAHEGAGGPGPASPEALWGVVSAACQEDVQFPISGFISKSQLCVISSAALKGCLVKEQELLPLC